MTRRAVHIVASALVLSALLALGAQAAPGAASGFGQAGSLLALAPDVREVRSFPTSEVGVEHPAGLAFSPRDGSLLIAETRLGHTEVIGVDLSHDRVGSTRLPSLSRPSTLSFDPARNRLTAVGRDALLAVPAGRATGLGLVQAELNALGLRDPRGATFDPTGSTLFILDNGTKSIVRVPIRNGTLGKPTRISLRHLGQGQFQGIAFNRADRLLYVMRPAEHLIVGLDRAGVVRRTYSLEPLVLADPRAIVFAPSADPTDDPAAQHLYIADAGGHSIRGRIVEASFVPRNSFASFLATCASHTLVDAAGDDITVIHRVRVGLEHFVRNHRSTPPVLTLATANAALGRGRSRVCGRRRRCRRGRRRRCRS